MSQPRNVYRSSFRSRYGARPAELKSFSSVAALAALLWTRGPCCRAEQARSKGVLPVLNAQHPDQLEQVCSVF
eukprot:1636308-Pyramimonas_sp.AAC.1